MVLGVAETWNLATLRRVSPVRVLLGAGAVAVAVALFSWVALPLAPDTLVVLTLPLAAAALALDPDAARRTLELTERPGPVERLAPIRTSMALGIALLASALWSPDSETPGIRAAGPLVLGIALGLLFAGLLRLARGKEQVLALLVCVPLAGWGLAQWLHLSAPALIFVAGLVLANDQVRRELVFTSVRELERPFLVAFLFVAGAWLPLEPDLFLEPWVWAVALGFVLVRAVVWRAAVPSGFRSAHVVAISPLALLFLLDMAPIEEAGCLLVLSLVAGEIASFVMARVKPERVKGDQP